MKLTCRCCGKKFESEKIGPPFCSERCRLMDLG
ncbi:MAG: DNA gyrase inhibitor YacG, partial [Deltaproteobacteria bacterium]|nr:DNA gyrase inhibitor YacG [Deltaproteobacteria bacterium]